MARLTARSAIVPAIAARRNRQFRPSIPMAGFFERAGAATWIGFGLMCLGMVMAILDVQVVAASLPTFQQALPIEP
jgi:hypothetical protein